MKSEIIALTSVPRKLNRNAEKYQLIMQQLATLDGDKAIAIVCDDKRERAATSSYWHVVKMRDKMPLTIQQKGLIIYISKAK
jgi:hypothetical protein